MFTKENTKQIKGIAILLMLAHHLFAFPDRMPYGMSLQTPFHISGMELTELIGGFGKICVSIYMFLGGYGLYKRYAAGTEKKSEVNNLGKDIVSLYKAYWRVFLIFVPIAFLFFSKQVQYCANEAICNRYAGWTMKNFLMNFTGLSHSFNSEWWFLWSYLFALFEGYIFIELFKNKKNLYSEIGLTMIWSILVMNVFPILPFKEGYDSLWSNTWYNDLCLGSEFVVLFFVGIIFAKYDIFDNWGKNASNLKRPEKILGALLVIGLVIYVREFFCTVEFDIILAPVFIFACYVFIEASRFLKRPLELLGNHSTNMWLVHTFFCFYFSTFAKIVYGSNNAALAYIILFLLSLGSSILINALWKVVGKGYSILRTCIVK